jgi:formylglycine-generating enzyme required for sulfatase activity
MYLVKTDDSGDTLWTRTYGGSWDDVAHFVQQTTDGGYILAGYTYSFGAGNNDFYLVKTNPLGDTLWTRTYGGGYDDRAYAVQQTADGGYIVAGWTWSFGAGWTDFYLVKTSPLGEPIWTRTYGGSNWDLAYSVQQTSDGGYIMAGETSSFGAGTYDARVVKTNSQGDTLWTRTYGGSSYDGAYFLQQTADGGYILAGYTNSFGAGTPTGSNMYLVKTNSLGDTLGTRNYGAVGNDAANAVQQTADGGYIVAGGTNSYTDFWLVKTGPEKPNHLTVYLDTSSTKAILRWVAPVFCNYNIYSTTATNALEAPNGWTLETTLYNIPAGSAEWTDPAELVDYKRYAVTMDCPVNQPPDAPSSPSPADDAIDQPFYVDLSWMCGDPEMDPLTYDVFFGSTSTPALVSSGQAATTYDPGVLEDGMTYYWQIVAHDNHGHCASGPVWSFTTEMTMVLVPAGSYQMGAEYQDYAQPVHTVNVPSFYIEIHEVTNAAYKAFCDATNHDYPLDPGFYDMVDYFTVWTNYPVLRISWDDAREYAEWVGKRLPTEAEWERAAKGDTDNRFYPWGDPWVYANANIRGFPDGYIHTAPVGNYPNGISPAGCYDMCGNVWEWCEDDWHWDYNGAPTDGSAWIDDPRASGRVHRGGSWDNIDPLHARCAYRGGNTTSPMIEVGFRCAKTP